MLVTFSQIMPGIARFIAFKKVENSTFSPGRGHQISFFLIVTEGGFLYVILQNMLINVLIFLFFSNSVAKRRDLSIILSRIAILSLFYCIILEVISFSFLSKGIALQSGLLYTTNLTVTVKIFIYTLSILILLQTGFYPRKVWISSLSSFRGIFLGRSGNSEATVANSRFSPKILLKMGESFRMVEYPLIIIFIITGGVFLVSTNDLISIFLSIELQSYGLYILTTMFRNSESSTTGGLIYFLTGGLSSCLILLGSSLLYANSGTTNLDGLYLITNLSSGVNSWYKSEYINFALLIFSVGFLVKVSAAPFHFWSLDVYDSIPTLVTLFVQIIAKITILIFFLHLIFYTVNPLDDLREFPQQKSWMLPLLLSAFFSLILGTVNGLIQFRIKRLLAYSTISHLAFMLLALTLNTVESIRGFLFYLFQYSLSNLNIFLIILSVGYSLYGYIIPGSEKEEVTEKNYSPIQFVSELRGFFYINPVLAIALAITVFSFIGVPPLIGFLGKQMVLSAALDNGYIFITILAVFTSVIGGVYYLNLVKEVFFFLPRHQKNKNFQEITWRIGDSSVSGGGVTFKGENFVLSMSMSLTISVITLIILGFIVANDRLGMGTILVQNLYES